MNELHDLYLREGKSKSSGLDSSCCQCDRTSTSARHPHIPHVTFCGECWARFEAPHGWEDLGVGD